MPFGPPPVDVTSSLVEGPVSHVAISGDNRTARYAAYDDGTHVFLRDRLSGQFHVYQGTSPSISGSVQTKARCLAYRDPHGHIIVRDLVRRVSRKVGIGNDPSISGDCRRVAFSSKGKIYINAPLKPMRRAKAVAAGSDPDLSLDNSALTWKRPSITYVRRAGHTTKIGSGLHPQVSDAGASHQWGVVIDRGSGVQLLALSETGLKWRKTIAVNGARHGGLTVYAADRGIVTYFLPDALWYFNIHSNNADDLFQGPVSEAATSARANYVVFASEGRAYLKLLSPS